MKRWVKVRDSQYMDMIVLDGTASNFMHDHPEIIPLVEQDIQAYCGYQGGFEFYEELWLALDRVMCHAEEFGTPHLLELCKHWKERKSYALFSFSNEPYLDCIDDQIGFWAED